MDYRELPAQPPQHHQQPPPFHYQQPPPEHYHHSPPCNHQQPLMSSQVPFYTPQFLTNNNNNNSYIVQQQNPSFHVPQQPLDSFNSQFTWTNNSDIIQQQNPTFHVPAQNPIDSLNSQFTSKKKRGRPRKYDNIALSISSSPSLHESEEQSSKKGRGRPAGSGKKQIHAPGSAGIGFTPHVITVDVGEDIASKIMDFSQQGPCTVCVLSANGTIWNVTLRQPAMSSSTVSYEGDFEIITLSGSFSLSHNNGSLNRIGFLRVSLAGPDGQVLGGVVAGALLAATPVQVILGSFITDGNKQESGVSPTLPPSMLNFGASAAGVSPLLQERSSESSDASGSSQLNMTTGPHCSTSEPITPLFSNMTWANSTMNMLPN